MKMSVGMKCGIATLVSTCLMFVVAGAGIWGIRGMNGTTDQMLKGEAKAAEHSAAVQIHLLELRRFEKDLFLNCTDQKKVAEYEVKFKENHASLSNHLDALRPLAERVQNRERVSLMTAELKTYSAAMMNLIDRIKAGEIKTPQEGNKSISDYKEAVHQLERSAEDLQREATARMSEVGGEVDDKGRTTVVIMAVFSVATALAWLCVCLVASRYITALMAQLKDAGASLTSASQQLSVATEELAAGAQEQSTALEETAASLEEITANVKQNADNARQASELAAGSRDLAEKGGHVVATAVTAMGDINQSARRITEIISVIDEIAFQTNLLALNAAVEAARAGDQGRGFAVVAAEVRNLAQRSASAAKEIKGLIQDSVGKVQTGSELVNKSGQTLEEIVRSVRQVTGLMTEIAASSQEQSTGIGQVSRAVAQIDSVVQQNAAQTEEISSTAQSLTSQAFSLQALIGQLRDRESQAAAWRAEESFSSAKDRRFVRLPGRANNEHRSKSAQPERNGVSKESRPPAPGAAAKNGSHSLKGGFEEF